jgi:hypothetical protein
MILTSDAPVQPVREIIVADIALDIELHNQVDIIANITLDIQLHNQADIAANIAASFADTALPSKEPVRC